MEKGDFVEKEKLEERKEKILGLMNHPDYQPMKIKELAILLQVPRERREELEETLAALLEEGKIHLSKRGKYGRAETFALQGVFTGNRKGFGFVTVEGREEDFFVPEIYTGGAFHKDTVRMIPLPPSGTGNRAEGRIIGVLKRGFSEVIGTYERSRNFGFVTPDDSKISADIFVAKEHSMGAVTGDKVIVKIRDYGTTKRNPEGIVKKILGNAGSPGVDILSVALSYGLSADFPEDVRAEAAAVKRRISPEDLRGRLDLRGELTVTIDGEDAKDLDDAITLTKRGSRYFLGVHIADVSHYVGEDSPLDREALRRGTSVYLIDRVIPMLPKELSNGICSLNPGEDRLALSCLLELDEKGNRIGERVEETVIRSDHRMTYGDVSRILDGDAELAARYEDAAEMFFWMKELSDLLREKRKKRGSIDFDLPESKILLNERGVPVSVAPYDRNCATRIIEDFMLLANETVAESYFWQDKPFLYRVHEKPDEEKIRALGRLIENFGHHLRWKNGELRPGELQKLLAQIADSPEEALVSRLTLRSLKRAGYSPQCGGHFGLAAPYYCHFTSPIRRYPDLQIHRIIKENLHGELTERRESAYRRRLPEVAKIASETERTAEEAEREVEKRKKCQYMERHVGEVFDGVISGVTNWGFYVELPSTVEGLVHVSSLEGDYYRFDEEHFELVGEVTNRRYRLGQSVRVRCLGVDRVLNRVDFVTVRSGKEEAYGEGQCKTDCE
ncbi:MAG: ribonuclease R [Lachnospiraceae bacterium]|nr:ribonuclease R [Lachnospiraceae bacterium]